MHILAIDTATIAASAAVVSEEKLCSLMYADYKLKHSEKLMPLIDAALSAAHLDISDIDCFAACKGPGSFTGIRIGAACVKGFAQAMNKPIVGISTLAAAAYINRTEPLIAPILDAQRDQVYTALFSAEDFVRQSEDAALSIDALLELIEEHSKANEKILFCGDGVSRFRDTLSEKLGNRARFADLIGMMPNAAACGELALAKLQRGEVQTYAEFLPNYIRASQPEEAKAHG